MPFLTNDTSDLDRSHRCGLPFQNTQKKTKKTSIFNGFYGAEETQSQHITSFLVQRATFQYLIGTVGWFAT